MIADVQGVGVANDDSLRQVALVDQTKTRAVLELRDLGLELRTELGVLDGRDELLDRRYRGYLRAAS